MKISILCKSHQNINGLARYAQSLIHQYAEKGIAYQITQPTIPSFLQPVVQLGKQLNYDLNTFLQTYPIATDIKKESRLLHLTTQEMATWLTLSRGKQPSIITVHDIFPYLLRHQGTIAELPNFTMRAFYQLVIRGLKSADQIIANSQYTKQTLVETLQISKERIRVIPMAVDHSVFRPRIVPPHFWKQYKLDAKQPILLYVGSDAPRKNLEKLLLAFQAIQKKHRDAILLKVGAFTNQKRATNLIAKVKSLGLEQSVRIIPNVSTEDLVYFYNAATAFIFPSLYEGFGFPPLEAMACGTPVVCSDTSALPEVVGTAALTFTPNDVSAIIATIERVLQSATLRQTLIKKGLVQAQTFQWSKVAEQTVEVYQEMLPSNQFLYS